MSNLTHVFGVRFVLEERGIINAWAKRTGADADPALRHLCAAFMNGDNLSMSEPAKAAALAAVQKFAEKETDEGVVNLLNKVRNALGDEVEVK